MKSLANRIDVIRSRVWLAEIRAVTGIQPILGIASRLDPTSICRSVDGVPHESKWYRYERGAAVPTDKLTKKINSALPMLTFDAHHPAWTLLRHPSPSTRTLERWIAKMPSSWRQILQNLERENFPYRQISLHLVTRYRLSEMSYLDALLLFEIARRQTPIKYIRKIENLIFIILVLPLLYIDDPLWKYQEREEMKSSLRAIVHSLKSSGRFFREILFPVDRLVQAIAMQRLLVDRHLQSHPRALNTRTRRIKFIASRLSDSADERYAIATTAFFREHPFILHGGTIYWDSDASIQSRWRQAWESIKRDDDFRHFSKCLSRHSIE